VGEACLVKRQSIHRTRLRFRYHHLHPQSGTMRHDMLQDGANYTPYDARKIIEQPATTVSGRKIVQIGKPVGRKQYGVCLLCDRSPSVACLDKSST
jgi:hypothetical protein